MKSYMSKATLGCRIGNVVLSDCFSCPLPKCRYEMNPVELYQHMKDLQSMGLLVTEFSSKGKIVSRR